MLPIFFNVHQVVHNVDAAGQQAEGKKDQGGLQQKIQVQQLAIEYQGGIDDDTFYPLARPHGAEETAQVACRRSGHRAGCCL